MNTMGISRRRRFSLCWRSGPVIPGMAISRIRQRVLATQSDVKNSSADANARTAKANSLSKSGSDSRTDSSSSTTEISGRSTVVVSTSSVTSTDAPWILVPRRTVVSASLFCPGRSGTENEKLMPGPRCQQSTFGPVTFDDGTADRKTYPHAVPLRRAKNASKSRPAVSPVVVTALRCTKITVEKALPDCGRQRLQWQRPVASGFSAMV
jgi:hypothetical protein